MAEGVPSRAEVLRTLSAGDRMMSSAKSVAEKYKAGAQQLLGEARSRKS